MNYPIYLDYAATTPVDSEVMRRMLPYFTEHFGNASSRFHAYGWQAEEAVDLAKKTIATEIDCQADEIIFTSGATESINLALKGVFENQNGHLITVQTEHKATLDAAKYIEEKGISVTYLDVNQDGNIDLDQLEASFNVETKLISVMQVNNETGVVLPISEIVKKAHEKGILVHVDMSQSFGKLAFPIDADLASFSGHKIYGPKGMGCLIVKKSVPISAQIHGGKHQRNRRSGTLNIPGIVGITEALRLTMRLKEEENARIENRKKDFEETILNELPFVSINGSGSQRVSNISNLCFHGLDGEELLMKLTKIAVSNGSACNSASTEPSYVLKAMGLSEEDSYGSLRFSLGRYTTEADMRNAADHVVEIVKKLC